MVRGSAASAAVLDMDSQSNREVLREVLERKRRNDAIRQHEFALLRQLRRQEEQGGALQFTAAAPAPAAPELLSSLFEPDARSSQTLQKIDEIEAQMSGQWWRGQAEAQAAAQADTAAKSTRRTTSRVHSQQPAESQLSPLEPVSLQEPVAETPAAATVSVDLDPPLELTLPAQSEPAATPPLAPVQAAPVQPPARFTPHPDLEEAAILFAHGDVEAARTRLLEQLVQALSAGSSDAEKISVLWLALLDLCRATGDEESFEPLAIDYAEHFGRSAPVWSSMPVRLGVPVLHGDAKQPASKRQFQWFSPSMLTVGSVTALRASYEGAEQPWSMAWARLTTMDEAALPALQQLIEVWADSDAQFVISDAGKLLELLERQTPLGEVSASQAWWTLRMAVLRWFHRMDAYEQVALDYCVTYEVSPPSWVPPRCLSVVQESGEADVSLLHEASLLSQQAATSSTGDASVATVAVQGLSGVLEGDPKEALEALSEQGQQGQELRISCDWLIRLDFVAAGSILNWTAEMQSRGYQLRFTGLHQLVAVFFCVIGIHEHARIEATKG